MVEPETTGLPRDAETRFALGMCLGAIALSWLGLAAAALNIQWGAAPQDGDALQKAWGYTSEMVLLVWLVFWPIVGNRGDRIRTRRSLLWEWAAMTVGLLPALGVSAFVSATSWAMAWEMVRLLFGASVLAIGVMAFGVSGRRMKAAVAVGVLISLGIVLPVSGFLWEQFFPQNTTWLIALPAASVAKAARGQSELPGATWGASAAWMVFGAILFWVGNWRSPRYGAAGHPGNSNANSA